jgi:Transport and Golgi organisation 2
VCTVVVSIAPADPMPLLLVGFRDEFTGRPWQPPARHWPGSPLVGGRDEQAGGTWLAVHPAIPRVSCVLNARGEPAALGRRRSRGELPLRAAGEGHAALRQLGQDHGSLARYDPFHLVCADLSATAMLSWDGRHAAVQELEPATHLITNVGRMYPRPAAVPAGPETAVPESADPEAASPEPAGPEVAYFGPRADHFGPKFAAYRPSGDPAATIKDAWGDWLPLADGDGLSDTDPAAVIVRHELPDGRVFGTTSVSLVALGAHGLRYDFQPVPGDPLTWYSVDIERL